MIFFFIPKWLTYIIKYKIHNILYTGRKMSFLKLQKKNPCVPFAEQELFFRFNIKKIKKLFADQKTTTKRNIQRVIQMRDY